MPDNSVASSPVGIVGQWGGRVLRGMRRASAGFPAGDDWALWHQACSGDAPSAIALVRALTPQAHGLAMQLLRKTEDAQDVVQESFLRLWSSRPSDACGARLTTFFNTIVINRCKTHLTKRREFTTDHETLRWVPYRPGNVWHWRCGLMPMRRQRKSPTRLKLTSMQPTNCYTAPSAR
ncbi:MAG: RNA polymerase sigma factor [Rhodoferax sp.]|nr:RNA polymerase sigma factor [Rhodoferax sp.]